MPSQQAIRRYYKPAVFVLCLLPALPAIHALIALCANRFDGAVAQWLVSSTGYWSFAQKADPIAVLLHEQGEWALKFLVLTLAITPLRFLLKQAWLLNFRRMFGLYAFTFTSLHFLIWLFLDQNLYWPGILEDLSKRPFITIGFAALVLMLPLAITSTNKMMRRLGKRWLSLHKLIYVIVPLGVWHFWWLVKKDISEPLIYAALTAMLLGYRFWRSKLRNKTPAATQATQ